MGVTGAQPVGIESVQAPMGGTEDRTVSSPYLSAHFMVQLVGLPLPFWAAEVNWYAPRCLEVSNSRVSFGVSPVPERPGRTNSHCHMVAGSPSTAWRGQSGSPSVTTGWHPLDATVSGCSSALPSVS